MEDILIPIITLVLCASVPIVAIVTNFYNKQSRLKLEVLKQEIELEKIKKEAFIYETEKLRLEIEQTRQQLLDFPNNGKN